MKLTRPGPNETYHVHVDPALAPGNVLCGGEQNARALADVPHLWAERDRFRAALVELAERNGPCRYMECGECDACLIAAAIEGTEP